MERQFAISVPQLRDRAARCRKMAHGFVSETVARELESIAKQYDEEASRLETARVDRVVTVPTRNSAVRS